MSFTYSIKYQLELELLKLKLGNKKLTKYEVITFTELVQYAPHIDVDIQLVNVVDCLRVFERYDIRPRLIFL